MLRPLVLGLTCSLALAATASAANSSVHFDPPDLNFEYQLHKQYQVTHGEQPPSGQGLIESYELQNGESLWGLSQMLYGDGNYWPKVWAQNKSISNPHLIQPGYTLHFQMGSEDDTPSFRFSEAEEPGLELAAAVSNNPQIEVPPPETPPRPIIGVPKSFPEWQSVYRHRKDNFGVDDSRLTIQRQVNADRIPLSAFVQEEPLVPLGTFLEVEKESGLPVANQYVYVKFNKGAGQIGQKYMIVKDGGVIRKLNEQVQGDIKARFIEVFGDLQLTELTEPHFSRKSDNEHFDVFRALILHAMSLTLTDFVLIPGEVQSVNLSQVGPAGAASAQILGSNKHVSSALYGPGDIVFLNKGQPDGIAEGQIFNLYIDRSVRDEETPVTFSSVASGKLKIAKVSGNVSTAVILTSIDSIQQGDRAQPHIARNESVPPPASEEKKSEPPSEFDVNPDTAPSGDDESVPSSEFDVK